MSETIIRGGRVIDPANGIDAVLDVHLRDGYVVAVGNALGAPGARVVEATGRIVTPGFVDLHAHLREPGFEQKGTIATDFPLPLDGVNPRERVRGRQRLEGRPETPPTFLVGESNRLGR